MNCGIRRTGVLVSTVSEEPAVAVPKSCWRRRGVFQEEARPVWSGKAPHDPELQRRANRRSSPGLNRRLYTLWSMDVPTSLTKTAPSKGRGGQLAVGRLNGGDTMTERLRRAYAGASKDEVLSRGQKPWSDRRHNRPSRNFPTRARARAVLQCAESLDRSEDAIEDAIDRRTRVADGRRLTQASPDAPSHNARVPAGPRGAAPLSPLGRCSSGPVLRARKVSCSLGARGVG
jgi:hypothetical protein